MAQPYTPSDVAGPVGGDPDEIGVYPLDEHNAALLNLVAPRGYENPTPEEGLVYDLVAIGAGAGGLVSSKQASKRGFRSALIERHLAGGDCLNVGCVPSKALIRCARAAQAVREAGRFGVSVDGAGVGAEGALEDRVAVDFGFVMERMRRLRAHIAPDDSYEGAQGAGDPGVDVYQGCGKFTSPHTIEVGGKTLRFRTAIVATGAKPKVPDIAGLADVDFDTNLTIFNKTECPKAMVVVGAGPIGLELAQAFAMFGTKVRARRKRGVGEEGVCAGDLLGMICHLRLLCGRCAVCVVSCAACRLCCVLYQCALDWCDTITY